METLGLDLAQVDYLVLSHEHGPRGGGGVVLEACTDLTVYLPRRSPTS